MLEARAKDIAPANPAHQKNPLIGQVRQVRKQALTGLGLGGRCFDARFEQNLPGLATHRKGPSATSLDRLSSQSRTVSGQKDRKFETTFGRFKSQGLDG